MIRAKSHGLIVGAVRRSRRTRIHIAATASPAVRLV